MGSLSLDVYKLRIDVSIWTPPLNKEVGLVNLKNLFRIYYSIIPFVIPTITVHFPGFFFSSGHLEFSFSSIVVLLD